MLPEVPMRQCSRGYFVATNSGRTVVELSTMIGSHIVDLPPKERCRNMGYSEAPLVHELRKVIGELREKCDVQERQIAELRDAVVALMEPDMPRVLRTKGGIMVLDKRAQWSRF
jgi:hypothetical protein